MPSFFEALKRILQGKPVFDASDAEEQAGWKDDNVTAATPQAPVGPKYIPVAAVERVDCRMDNERMDCDVFIRNNSTVALYLDKITFLGTIRELDIQLNPGQEREFRIYSGPKMKNRNYEYAELMYKTTTGDYFRALHSVEFRKESDDTYEIVRLKFIPPVKDI